MYIYAYRMHKYETPTLRGSTSLKSSFAGARIPVAIVGARGYSGLELARVLLQHPGADLRACFAGDSKFSLSDQLFESAARAVPVLPSAELPLKLSELGVVFLATPAEVSIELAPKILEAGVDVIDLSGAFRLTAKSDEDVSARYRAAYALEHPRPDLVRQAHYGLVPFATAIPSGKGRLISNPGCYATSAMMGLIPLLRDGVIEASSIVIDAKSGASGGGRKAAENLLFCEVEGECLPYRVGRHQHLPEIRQWAESFSGVAISPHFATHLLPVRRGILASIYARLKPGRTADSVQAAYATAFEADPLVRVHRLGSASAAMDSAMLSLKRVAGSARTQICFHVEGDQLYAFAVIDNLLKGAAGQAVENFNRLHSWSSALGLEDLEGTL